MSTKLKMSLLRTRYQLGRYLEGFKKSYTGLLYKGIKLPSPAICIELLSLFKVDLPENVTYYRLNSDVMFQEHFLNKIYYSSYFKSVLEVSKKVGDKDSFWDFFQKFLEILFSYYTISDQFLINSSEAIFLYRDLCEDDLDSLDIDYEVMESLDFSDFAVGFRSSNTDFTDEDIWELYSTSIIKEDSLIHAVRDCKGKSRFFDKIYSTIYLKLKNKLNTFFDENKNKSGDYPVGGISEISTKGSISNLLQSELIYSENTSEIDLFDVRYAEGDLLYFQRDTNQLDSFTYKINFDFIYGSSYIDRYSFSTRPFFVFSFLNTVVKIINMINESYKFKFHINTYGLNPSREDDYQRVFETLFIPEKEKQNVIFNPKQEQENVDQKFNSIKTVTIGNFNEHSDMALFWDKDSKKMMLKIDEDIESYNLTEDSYKNLLLRFILNVYKM